MAKLGRHWSVVGLLVIVFWLLASLIQSQEVYAGGKKFSGSGKVATILSQTKMFPGDVPKHVITMTTRLDVEQSSDPTFGKSEVKRFAVSDYIAGSGVHRGYGASTHSSGDQWFSAFEGKTKTVPKPGEFPKITFDGKWWFTGGTGNFKGIKGGGTYTGRVTKAGATYEFEGEYELAM